MKKVVICPHLKKPALDPKDLANIPFVGKVLKGTVDVQLQRFMDDMDYLDSSVLLSDDFKRDLDRGGLGWAGLGECMSLLILLNLSAAFMTIDHGMLLESLVGLGWFHSFSSDRTQKVVPGDFCSFPWSLAYEGLQGSTLSPMLFGKMGYI